MTEPLSLRINSDLKARLVAMADKDHRSLNNLVELLLSTHPDYIKFTLTVE